LFGKRFLHAERISPCAAGNQIITPVSSLPALPSGKVTAATQRDGAATV
jgi:hypothetical protein